MTQRFLPNGKPEGVYVNRMQWGQRYLFASVSIPDDWIEPGTINHRADLGELLRLWREAYEAQRARPTP